MTERLTVRGVEPRLLKVPLRRALHTSASRITDAPLLLIDVLTEQGVTGRAYLFCYVRSPQASRWCGCWAASHDRSPRTTATAWAFRRPQPWPTRRWTWWRKDSAR